MPPHRRRARTPRPSNYRPQANRLLGVIDGYLLPRSPGHILSGFFHPPVTSCFKTTSTPPSPAGPAPHPKSLAPRLYRGTGNKSRPVFASLRRKVERRSWPVCFTAPGARRSLRLVATRRAGGYVERAGPARPSGRRTTASRSRVRLRQAGWECSTTAGRCFGSAHRDVSRPDQLDKYDGAAASAPLHRASKSFRSWIFGFPMIVFRQAFRSPDLPAAGRPDRHVF